MMVDVHGDEELPYVFIAGNAGIPEWSAVQNDLQVCVSPQGEGGVGNGKSKSYIPTLWVFVSPCLRP